MSDFINIQTTSAGPVSSTPASSSDSFLSRPGGVLEYRVGSTADDGMMSRAPTSLANPHQANLGGVTTITGNGQVQHTPAVQTVTTKEFTGGHTGFLATARNNGFPAMGRLTAESVVNFQGMEVSLSSLEALGYVRQTPNGSYEAVGQPQQSSAQPQQGQVPPKGNTNGGNQGGIDPFPAEVESAVARAVGSIPQGVLNSAMASALEGGLDSINFNELAYLSGKTPAEARQAAGLVLTAFSHQADAIAKAQGINNPRDVWEWAAEEQPEKFANARRMQTFGRSTSALRELVTEYINTVPPTAEALRRGGYEVRIDSNGNELFNYRGRWITPESAVLAGLV